MIQNERQYEITRKKLHNLREELERARQSSTPGVPLEIQQAGCGGIQMLMEDLQAELFVFERLRSGQTESLPLPSVLDDLPTALVQARVARGWSHRDLANALGTSEQQVQKDESGGYSRASLQRIHRVADVLEIVITGQVTLHSPKALR